MSKLSWDDLIIQPIASNDATLWLQNWAPRIKQRVAPVFLSKFGDWFLRCSDGGTEELSVIEGTFQRIASTPEEFAALVNSQQWQEDHLLSLHVFELHSRGLIPGAKQCYAFAPHPILTGRIDLDQAMIMDIGVWQNICAQIFVKAQG